MQIVGQVQVGVKVGAKGGNGGKVEAEGNRQTVHLQVETALPCPRFPLCSPARIAPRRRKLRCRPTVLLAALLLCVCVCVCVCFSFWTRRVLWQNAPAYANYHHHHHHRHGHGHLPGL